MSVATFCGLLNCLVRRVSLCFSKETGRTVPGLVNRAFTIVPADGLVVIFQRRMVVDFVILAINSKVG